MAIKTTIAFALLAFFVAASMQMPDYEPRSRVRRQDPEPAEKPTKEAPSSGQSGGNTGSGSSGGGFTGTGPSSNGNAANSIPGQDLASNIIQSITSENSPGSNIWQQVLPFIEMFSKSKASSKAPV